MLPHEVGVAGLPCRHAGSLQASRALALQQLLVLRLLLALHRTVLVNRANTGLTCPSPTGH